ncbi:uracil-DNA glycosylase [Pararhodospirillum oryzae]|uniref:Type-4 uracil-DNA glycosylase n=1 Tax=Pararhodospirillum oryzae TaxID=478448 RepID=A0A512HAP2_9PROT|nr:uracil-DNA glycosylase [Pararhodospirillum oryzae]GEO82505.1 DNA polymerase [Pararhodospirillum oryzae]
MIDDSVAGGAGPETGFLSDSLSAEASALAADPVALLRWYVEAGVDVAVGETALDRFALSAQRPAPSPARALAPAAPSRPARSPGPARAPLAGGGALFPPAGMPGTPSLSPRDDASHLAAAAASLEELKHALDGFTACTLRRTATNTVFADGNPASGVMIVGEAPGADEDRLGLPFVGVSGQLLNRMLESIGLDRRTCYITNVVPWRPPGNRKPTADEVALCLPFLERHIALVAPRLLVALGGLAAQSLFARNEGITRLRGRWMTYASPALSRPVPALATFHPAYLLRTPGHKRLAWRDMLAVRQALETGAPPVQA